MSYCENCGAELEQGARFCGECGTLIKADASIQASIKQIDLAQGAQEEFVTDINGITSTSEVPFVLEDSDQAPLQRFTGQEKHRKKAIILVAVIIVLLAAAAIALWQSGLFEKETESAAVTPAQAADKNNLYGTLDWQEDQDKTYAFKNLLIEGNSDANIKEIFEESAYFTPSEYKYAKDGDSEYYLATCEYKKDDETATYALVFQTNKDEHLELLELYQGEERVKEEQIDDFYKNLYITKDDVAESKKKAKEKAAAETKSNQEYYFKENENHWFYNAEKDAYLELMYFGENCVFANIWGGGYDETMDEFDFNFSDLYFFANTSGKENHIIANEPYFCDEGGDFQLNLTVTTTDDVTDKDFPYMVMVEDELFPTSSLVSGTYYEFYPDM